MSKITIENYTTDIGKEPFEEWLQELGKQEDHLLVLLIGGDKGTQTRDIEKAKRYWRDYKGIKS
jgi:hypothetical protein